ncbi:MAG: efflux RND transporter periplasmic adaptor subunit [Campylobacter sp.]|nr:efflux RND transporter periplasmic adaptor subunit [Campylobacter sp.]
MRNFIKFIIIAVVLIACYSVYRHNTLKDANKINYITTKPIKGDLVNSVVANGEVFAQDLVEVGAQVSGKIEKLYVKLGDKVKKGDMIAQIDSVKQENEVSKQESQLKIHNANLAKFEVAYKIAKDRYDREEKLYKAKASTYEALESAKNELMLQSANLQQVKSQIEQTTTELSTARTDLGYTKISSPLDGVVVSLPVKEGQTLNSFQTTPIVAKVADLSKMEINFEISEADIPKVKVGMRVDYKILAFNDIIKTAHITSIDPALTTLSDGTYGQNSLQSSSNSAVYYYAKALIDNSDEFLKIGMTTQNSIIIEDANDTIYIPTSAIISDKDGKFVQILKSGEPKKVAVKTGISNSINTEIISGIDENDEVILGNSSSTFSSNSPSRPRVRM